MPSRARRGAATRAGGAPAGVGGRQGCVLPEARRGALRVNAFTTLQPRFRRCAQGSLTRGPGRARLGNGAGAEELAAAARPLVAEAKCAKGAGDTRLEIAGLRGEGGGLEATAARHAGCCGDEAEPAAPRGGDRAPAAGTRPSRRRRGAGIGRRPRGRGRAGGARGAGTIAPGPSRRMRSRTRQAQARKRLRRSRFASEEWGLRPRTRARPRPRPGPPERSAAPRNAPPEPPRILLGGAPARRTAHFGEFAGGKRRSGRLTRELAAVGSPSHNSDFGREKPPRRGRRRRGYETD